MKQKKSLKAWFFATRPWSFTASGLSVLAALVYLAWLGCEVDWTLGILAIVGIVLFHAAGNTWSDYHDFKKGVDNDEAICIDTLTKGHFSPGEIRTLSLTLLLLGIGVGLYLMVQSGWWLLLIGVGGLLCTLLYPPLKYRALGDLVILLAYGFLPALGTSYVALGEVDWRVLWMAVPVGLLVDAILHANNTRDMVSDGRAHIRTMAMEMGVRASVVLYVLEQLVPFVWVVVLIPFGVFPLSAFLAVVVMRFALRNTRLMREYGETGDPAIIAPLDQLSAQVQMLFVVAMVAAMGIDMWIR